MVSLNDTAAQLQISTLKQDAAEAAFKARHSFGSSDAFKQIFDGIDRTAATLSAPKDDSEPAGQEVRKLVHASQNARMTAFQKQLKTIKKPAKLKSKKSARQSMTKQKFLKKMKPMTRMIAAIIMVVIIPKHPPM